MDNHNIHVCQFRQYIQNMLYQADHKWTLVFAGLPDVVFIKLHRYQPKGFTCTITIVADAEYEN